MLYMVTFTINIPPMLAYIPYMDPMGTVVVFALAFQSVHLFAILDTRPIKNHGWQGDHVGSFAGKYQKLRFRKD